MTKDQMDWFREQYQLCRDQGGQTPKPEDFRRAVTDRMKLPNAPIHISETDFQALILKAYRAMEVEDLMNSEIDEKSRYAEANVNSRKYVDGSF